MEDGLLLHIYVWLNKMTDVQDCCQRNGAYISFLENVCTFETAKINLTPLNKCLFVSVLWEDA